MTRYSHHLRAAYESLGHSVHLYVPSQTISSRFGTRSVKKTIAYIEQAALLVWVLIRRLQADIVHIADHSDAFFAYCFRRDTRILVTCHDIFGILAASGQIPEYSAGTSGKFYHFLVVRGLKKARLIVCVSETTRLALVEFCPQLETRCFVVHNAVDRGLVLQASTEFQQEKYCLIVGGNDWRKRRSLALEVAKRVIEASDGMLNCVKVVGPSLDNQEFARAPEATDLLQDVSDYQLAQLYHSAVLLIQMSKYEGFCWPVVEANAFGVPAVCASIAVLKEVGPSNIFIDVDEISSTNWSDVFKKTIDPVRRHQVQFSTSNRYSFQNFTDGIAEAIARSEVRR